MRASTATFLAALAVLPACGPGGFAASDGRVYAPASRAKRISTG